MRTKGWSKEDLVKATKSSRSIRQIIKKLGLKEAGGNYTQIKKYLNFYRINTEHLKGKAWNKGMKMPFKAKIPLVQILIKNSNFQSYKLKKRLFRDEIKNEACEICGWSEKSRDGRIPLELDHINGDSKDNRIENLRILCPNCHSLQNTHRALNIKK
ncbi:HNH endonuclease signature motif containing protein [Patescibacteria group bacterium]